MPSKMDKNGRATYPEAVPDAVQPFSGFLGRKFQDIPCPFGWDLLAHNLTGWHFAQFQRE